MKFFVVYGHDNGSFAFQEQHSDRCEFCGLLVQKWQGPLEHLVLARRDLDVSATFDGVLVGSRRVVDFCEREAFDHLVARPIPAEGEFFALSSDLIVRFDSAKRRTRFIDRCPVCGQHESVIGATPAFLVEGSNVPARSFAQTDLEFGSGDGKHPLLICGELVAKRLRGRGFEGLELRAGVSD